MPYIGILYLCIATTSITPKVRMVIPGKLYRSRQMNKKELAQAIDTYGIQVIINLRGPNKHEPWWQDEHQVAQKKNVTIHDIPLSARKLPSKMQVLKLTTLFKEHQNKPILIHCHRGCDRTSAACALYQFEYALGHNISIQKAQKLAKKQLSTLKYGHWKIFFPAVDAFVREWITLRKKYNSIALALKHYNPTLHKSYEVSS